MYLHWTFNVKIGHVSRVWLRGTGACWKKRKFFWYKTRWKLRDLRKKRYGDYNRCNVCLKIMKRWLSFVLFYMEILWHYCILHITVPKRKMMKINIAYKCIIDFVKQTSHYCYTILWCSLDCLHVGFIDSNLQAEIQTDLSQKLDKATVALATGKG